MFRPITINWRGRPLTSHEVIVEVIASTRAGIRVFVRAELDTNAYPTGVKVTDEPWETVNVRGAKFHGEWNSPIRPTRKPLATSDSP